MGFLIPICMNDKNDFFMYTLKNDKTQIYLLTRFNKSGKFIEKSSEFLAMPKKC